MFPIVFLFGPSGSGKTYLTEKLLEAMNWLHVDFDSPPEEATPEFEKNRIKNLRKELKNFWASSITPPPIEYIQKMALDEKKAGAILTFPSTDFMYIHQLRRADSAGITSILLYGPEMICYDAYKARREKTNMNVHSFENWFKRNKKIYTAHKDTEYVPYFLDVFQKGTRKDVLEVQKEVLKRLH